MIYNIFPTKDTTLYDYSQSMNTGRDPILEVEKLTSGSDFPGTRLARTLLWFDWDKDFSGSLTKAPLNFTPSSIFCLASNFRFGATIPIFFK